MKNELPFAVSLREIKGFLKDPRAPGRHPARVGAADPYIVGAFGGRPCQTGGRPTKPAVARAFAIHNIHPATNSPDYVRCICARYAIHACYV